MRIAITGAVGTIGEAVSRLALSAGHTVVRIDRDSRPEQDRDRTVLHLDLADYPGLVDGLAGCDALIHLAAINGPGREPDHVVHDNNVIASYHALRAAAEVGIARVCQASSVNAVGGRFSRWPRYDYFPLDESHPCYAEDPYSLSKWVCEQQADAIARRYERMSIASLRFHGVVVDRADTAGWAGTPNLVAERQLWGYTSMEAAARACVQAVTVDLGGHEAFYVVAPETMVDTPSMELRARHYPDVPLRSELPGNSGFFDCNKAFELLGWSHDAG